MTRNAMLKKLIGMARKLEQKYDYETNYRMWTLCNDWNRDHEDEEIFMCEDYDDDDRYRFFIEDDFYYVAD